MIDVRFRVAFLAPEANLSVTDPSFLAEGAALLTLPAAATERPAFSRLAPLFGRGHSRGLACRARRCAAGPAHRDGPGLGDVWKGRGEGSTELLSVFRNFDDASVVPGFVETTPKAARVMDRPIFERIFYELAAGCDMFGSDGTQRTTRLHMDHPRREAATLFLSFMPADRRREMHTDWCRGPLVDLRASGRERRADDERPTAVPYRTDDPKAEFPAALPALPARAKGRWAPDLLDTCRGAGRRGLPRVARAGAALRRGRALGSVPAGPVADPGDARD
ncbi:MAG: fatty acid cis/trans isomerase [Pseudomonadota bacterium]|nr:fatty acid cis/trans isomerase [Pseudomonadota bacterium]